MDHQLDMTGMYAAHDALRRDLVQIARITGKPFDNPAKQLNAALGWEYFKKFLTIHHEAEDDLLWPPLRAHVASNPDKMALVDALEDEHAVIDPLIAAADAAGADPDYGHERFGDIIDELTSKLIAHLAHEEADGLPLIDASVSQEEWMHYITVQNQRIGDERAIAVPWMLSGATPQLRQKLLAAFPPVMLSALRQQWEPSYASLNLWNTTTRSS